MQHYFDLTLTLKQQNYKKYLALMSSDDLDEFINVVAWKKKDAKKGNIGCTLTKLINHGGNICAREHRAHPTQFQNCY